jgi:anti-anti-sigma factor
VLRFSAGLFFATSDVLQDRLRQAALASGAMPLTAVVIDFGGINFIDSQGAATMSQIISIGRQHGIDIRLARVQPAVFQVLEAQGVVEQLGRDRFHPNIYDAVSTEVAASEPSPQHP